MKRPVVGLLCARVFPIGRLGVYTGTFRRYMAAGRRAGALVYAFTPAGVDRRRSRVRGVTLDRKGRWRVGSFPLPGALYNRFPTLLYGRYRVLELLAYLRARGCRMINGCFPGKWVIHRLIAADPGMRGHLPVSRLIRSPADVLALLERFRTVYVKPTGGSLGVGIVRIRRLRGTAGRVGWVSVRGQAPTGGRLFRVLTRRGLIRFLAPYARRRRFMVQQGISLSLPGGRVYDLRCLVQRNASGHWEVTGIAARVGGLGSVTSNLHTGGAARRPEHVLAELGLDAKAKLAEVQRFCLKAARALERALGSMGDLGLDLGVDRRGRIYYIEANPKPGRLSFIRLDPDGMGEKAVMRPLEYALYLARGGRPQ